MKKLYISAFLTLALSAALLSSCSYNPGPNVLPADTTHNSKLTIKQDFKARYDIYVVDTSKNGNNADIISPDSVKKNIEQIVIDTTRSLTDKNGITKNHVAVVITYINPQGSPQDTGYFYQDPNGDLYRYNFGFSILNQYTFLTQNIGHNIDVGWVLVAKLSAAAGTTWIAKSDTEQIQSPQINVFLKSVATMKADTNIVVGTETFKARHVQHVISAATPTGLGIDETGQVIIDSYMSADLGAVLIDFFRHSTLQGKLANSQTQGKFKIMTSYQK